MAQHTFIPTPYEAATAIVASIFILGVLTLQPIIKNINSESYTFVSDRFGSWLQVNLDKLNTPKVTTVLTFLLWAVVGALVYVLIWSGTALLKSMRDDVSPFHNLIPPMGYQPQLTVPARMAKILIRLIACVLLIVLAGIFFAKILPYSVTQLVTALVRIDALSIVGVFLSVLYVAVSLFAFVVGLRLVLLRRRIFDRK